MMNMYKTETGEIFKRYLERLIGNKVERNELVCWPHKNKLDVNDIEIFNEIANKHGINELNKTGGFHYYIKIPNHNYQDVWTVTLSYELEKEFLTKYGNYYKID